MVDSIATTALPSLSAVATSSLTRTSNIVALS
jgi:hypothetical protein